MFKKFFSFFSIFVLCFLVSFNGTCASESKEDFQEAYCTYSNYDVDGNNIRDSLSMCEKKRCDFEMALYFSLFGEPAYFPYFHFNFDESFLKKEFDKYYEEYYECFKCKHDCCLENLHLKVLVEFEDENGDFKQFCSPVRMFFCENLLKEFYESWRVMGIEPHYALRVDDERYLSTLNKNGIFFAWCPIYDSLDCDEGKGIAKINDRREYKRQFFSRMKQLDGKECEVSIFIYDPRVKYNNYFLKKFRTKFCYENQRDPLGFKWIIGDLYRQYDKKRKRAN